MREARPETIIDPHRGAETISLIYVLYKMVLYNNEIGWSSLIRLPTLFVNLFSPRLQTLS